MRDEGVRAMCASQRRRRQEEDSLVDGAAHTYMHTCVVGHTHIQHVEGTRTSSLSISRR